MHYDASTRRWIYDSPLEEALSTLRARSGQWSLTTYETTQGDPHALLKGLVIVGASVVLTLLARAGA